MKRRQRNLQTVILDLKKQGVTNKTIAKKMGVSVSSLTHYGDYFRADKGTKHSRKPKETSIKKLRKFAQSKKIRTTQDYHTDFDGIIYIAVNYSGYYVKDGEPFKNRFNIIRISRNFFNELKNKETFLIKRIEKDTEKKGSDPIVITKFRYQVKTDQEFKTIVGYNER